MERFVTVQELCRTLGVSRTRLYSLTREGILPEPMRNPSNGRPLYTSDQVERCHQVFKTQIGVNGHPYTPNRKRGTGRASVPQRGQYQSLIASLSALGMTCTIQQVGEAVKSLPDAGKGLGAGELVKQVFLRLRQTE
jgi:hypothetical protein